MKGCVVARIEGTVDIEFFPLLSLFNEIDLFSMWMPKVWGYGLLDSKIVHRKSITDMTAYANMKWPPPFSGREFLVNVSGYDCMTEKDTLKQVVV